MSTDSPTADQLAAILQPARQFQNDRACPVEGCHRPQRTRGLCSAHYLRALRAEKRQAREATGSSS